eukprot:742962-Hanusia_phi.AAC.4
MLVAARFSIIATTLGHEPNGILNKFNSFDALFTSAQHFPWLLVSFLIEFFMVVSIMLWLFIHSSCTMFQHSLLVHSFKGSPFVTIFSGRALLKQMEDYSLHDPMSTFAKCRSGSWVVRKEEFSFTRKIAEGAMGSVFLANLRGQTVAAKMLKKTESAGMQAYRDLITELDILISIGKHPNIVEFIGACIDDPQSPIGEPC